MSLYAMPFLVYNLGGEMIYILEQRLEAQQIETDKAKKVLIDVTEHMFNPQFQEELVKPQRMYSNTSIREVFDRLAHSSIMRLSSSSMDKLYDLMTMGLKQNIIQCGQPQEVVQITLNHLDAILKLVSQSERATQYINSAVKNVIQISSGLSHYEWNQLRCKILEFLQDRNIKVSLFLNAGLQNRIDGSFIIDIDDYQMGSDQPGTLKTYDLTGSIFERVVLESHPFMLFNKNDINHFDTSSRTSSYGHNLYLDPKRCEENKTEKQPTQTTSVTQKVNTTDLSAKTFGDRAEYNPSAPIVKKKENEGPKDLNYLAKLIGGASEDSKTISKGTFKIENLFPETKVAQESDSGKPETYVLHFQPIKSGIIQSVYDEFDSVQSHVASNTEEDLLSLMDNA